MRHEAVDDDWYRNGGEDEGPNVIGRSFIALRSARFRSWVGCRLAEGARQSGASGHVSTADLSNSALDVLLDQVCIQRNRCR